MVKILEFYNVRTKKKFKTSNYRIVGKIVKGNRRQFAIAMTPGKNKFEAWRVLPKGFKK